MSLQEKKMEGPDLCIWSKILLHTEPRSRINVEHSKQSLRVLKHLLSHHSNANKNQIGVIFREETKDTLKLCS